MIPGISSPCANRQPISQCSDGDVAASRIGSVSSDTDATIVCRRPNRSASSPTAGAASAIATVVALTVRLTWNFDA